MRFDRVAILDWSAAKGPKRGKDSIWLGLADASGTTAENIPTRHLAEARLTALVDQAVSRGERLLIGADFAFGFPTGFASSLTGTATALSVWAWLAARVTDTPRNVTNYRDVAARMNAGFGGDGPFWGNGMALQVPGLSRLKPALPPGLAAHRHCDIVARESGAAPKTVWQLAGAGAVGAQVLTGLPMLHRLRGTFAGRVSVWPFEEAPAPVVLAEVYPSLLHARISTQRDSGAVPDQVQVTLLAAALFAHAVQGGLPRLMAPTTAPEILAQEGWMIGAGQSAFLMSTLP